MGDDVLIAIVAVGTAIFMVAALVKSRPSTEPRCAAFAQRFGIHDLVGHAGYSAAWPSRWRFAPVRRADLPAR